MFGRLHRNVPQEKLDLLQLASRCVAEPSTGPSQIPVSPCPSYFVDPAFLDQLPLRRANRPVQFSPNREPELFERGLLCRPNQRWPNVLRAVGDDPMSKSQLLASSTHTRVAMRARLGRVFFSIADDRRLATAHGLALPLTSFRGECPASSLL